MFDDMLQSQQQQQQHSSNMNNNFLGWNKFWHLNLLRIFGESLISQSWKVYFIYSLFPLFFLVKVWLLKIGIEFSSVGDRGSGGLDSFFIITKPNRTLPWAQTAKWEQKMLMHLSSIFHVQCFEELSSLCGPYFCVMCYTLENIKIAVGYDGHMLSI